MKKKHWEKFQISPNFRKIVRPMMSVRLDRSSPSENGIVTSVVKASSLLERLGVTFDCCSKLRGNRGMEGVSKEVYYLVASTFGIVDQSESYEQG